MFRPGPNDPTPPQYPNRRGAMRACSRSMAGIIPGAGFPVSGFSRMAHRRSPARALNCSRCERLCVVESTCKGYHYLSTGTVRLLQFILWWRKTAYGTSGRRPRYQVSGEPFHRRATEDRRFCSLAADVRRVRRKKGVASVEWELEDTHKHPHDHDRAIQHTMDKVVEYLYPPPLKSRAWCCGWFWEWRLQQMPSTALVAIAVCTQGGKARAAVSGSR